MLKILLLILLKKYHNVIVKNKINHDLASEILIARDKFAQKINVSRVALLSLMMVVANHD